MPSIKIAGEIETVVLTVSFDLEPNLPCHKWLLGQNGLLPVSTLDQAYGLSDDNKPEVKVFILGGDQTNAFVRSQRRKGQFCASDKVNMLLSAPDETGVAWHCQMLRAQSKPQGTGAFAQAVERRG